MSFVRKEKRFEEKPNRQTWKDSEVNIEFVDGKVILTASDLICRMCGGYVNRERDIPICKSCIARVKKL